MRLYAGLDIHTDSITGTIKDEQGNPAGVLRIPNAETSGKGVKRSFARVRGKIRRHTTGSVSEKALGYHLKKYPEDFIVKELPLFSLGSLTGSGRYAICLLKKKRYTTIRAVEQIAQFLGKDVKEIGFAGIKDKNAITEQFISIKNLRKKEVERVRLRDIELRFAGYRDKPISLGDLKGNEFIITVRNFKGALKEERVKESKTKDERIKEERMMPNFFGGQRFSQSNIRIGKLLLEPDFKGAIRLILETNSDYNKEIERFTEKNPNDFVGALRLIPGKLLRLYVHSYQSYLWNRTLNEYLKEIRGSWAKRAGISTRISKKSDLSPYEEGGRIFSKSDGHSSSSIGRGDFCPSDLKLKKLKTLQAKKKGRKNVQIPLIGFGTELDANSPLNKKANKKANKPIIRIIKKIMKTEGITFRSFISHSIPDISLEGGLRRGFAEIKDLKILEKKKGTVKLSFRLDKGSYGTEAVKFILSR